MGSFKINGVELGTCAEVVSSSSLKTKSAFFTCGKINLPSDIPAGYTIANAPAGYPWTQDICKGQLKVSGNKDSVSAKGSRPSMLECKSYTTDYSGTSLTISVDSSGRVYLNTGLTLIPASVKAKYFFMIVSAPGGGGGGGKGYYCRGAGGGGGSACLMLVKVPTSAGTIMSVYIGSPGGGGSNSSNGGGGTTSYVYNASGNAIATLGAGSGGKGGANNSADASGGSGGTCSITTENIPSGWYVAGFSGKTGGKGGSYATSNASGDGETSVVTISSATTFYGTGGTTKSGIMMSGETFSSSCKAGVAGYWASEGAAASGNASATQGYDKWVTGGGGGNPVFQFSPSVTISSGYSTIPYGLGGANSTAAQIGAPGGGGGGGGASSAIFSTGGYGGRGGYGFISVYY